MVILLLDFPSPKGAALHSGATLLALFVARRCSTARSGNTSAPFRRPRVQHGTLGKHFSAFSSPESAARHTWATLSSVFVARECSTACSGNTSAPFRRPRVQGRMTQGSRGLFGNEIHTFRRPRVQHGMLGRHFRAFSSPESAARYARATLQLLSVAQGCKAE